MRTRVGFFTTYNVALREILTIISILLNSIHCLFSRLSDIFMIMINVASTMALRRDGEEVAFFAYTKSV